MIHAIEQIGAFAGLAAFLGLAVLALISFTQGRDIRRLREWAGSAPERDAERKEQTSTIAAQRAEELRALEEARTAEQEAVSSREERRKRREEGLPEQTFGERLRGRFSSFGETASKPGTLIALFVVIIAIVGGVAYLLVSGGDESASGGNGAKQAAAKIKPAEIEVSVLNGTSVPGLAATSATKSRARASTSAPSPTAAPASPKAWSCSNAATSRKRARWRSSWGSRRCSR